MESSVEGCQDSDAEFTSASSVDSDLESDFEDLFDLTPLQQHVFAEHTSRWTKVSISMSQAALDNTDRISTTWQALVSHHPVLRTVIVPPSSKGRPYQQAVLRRYSPVQLAPIEKSISSSGTHEPAWLLYVSSGSDPGVYIHIHAALVDTTSISVLREDFITFFDGGLMSLSRSMIDYAAYVRMKGYQSAQQFWKDQVDGIDLPPLHTILSLESETHVPYCTTLKPYQLEATSSWAGGLSRPLVLAVWALTLATHTESSNDIVAFGTSGRDKDFEDRDAVVGYADQTYPLKLTLNRNLKFTQWVKTVDEADALFSKHAFIGYGEIRRQSSDGFFPHTKIILTNSSTDDTISEPDRHKINVFVNWHDWSVLVKYASDIPEAKIRVLLDHFKAGLSFAIRNPSEEIGNIDLVSSTEREYLLVKGAAATTPVEGLVHTLFEKQVTLTPEADALQFEGDKPLTYQRVNCLANGIARQLVCGRGHLIPLCLQRSVNLIIAILAVLKTGAAYVPMDPDVPLDRLRFIEKDVHAPFVMVDKSTAGKFVNEVLIEDLVEPALNGDCSNLNIWQSPTDIVYVIYTSGSTGNPKGVLLEHRAAFTGLMAFPTISNLRQLLFHNPVFSAAQRSIFSTLKQGGCLCIASKDNLTVFIQDTINLMQINTIDVTPSTATLITPGTVPCLLRMTVAGELINPALVPEWIDRLELLNAYGLSENTQFNWRQVIQPGQSPQNIGRPTDTTTSYVLLPDTQKLAPLLVPGELCLGGHQLARGYLNRPEKTSEVFFPNPFGRGRLYRTGDMVVTQEDGSIEMIGRIDFQVKINDQRVEPGESNAILQIQKEVAASAVVSARVSGKKSLVAVIVPSKGVSLTTFLRPLQNTLRQQLPTYMIPSYWVESQDLPLNINGKVDIPALRSQVENLSKDRLLYSIQIAQPQSEPVSEVEHSLRRVISERLSLNPASVGMNVGFLDLGGTSLDSIVIVSRLRDIGLNLSTADMLSARSIRDIATKAEKAEEAFISIIEPFSLVEDHQAIDRMGLDDAYPATPLQEGVLADTVLGRANHIYTRVYSIQGISVDQIKSAISAVVAKHEILRTSFIPYRRGFLQVVRQRVEVPWEEKNEPLDIYLHHNASCSMEVDGPLFRVAVLNSQTFVLSIHHALFDFWSNEFVCDDLNALLLGTAIPSRVPYNHYVHFVEGQYTDKNKAFWKSYLRDAQKCHVAMKAVLSAEEGALDYKAMTLRSPMPVDLQQYVTKSGITVGALMHTAWAITLASSTGTNDVLFITTLSGRDAPVQGILNINGPTLCTVPMRVSLRSSDTLEEVARNVQINLQELSQYAYIGMRNILHECGLPMDCMDTMVNFTVKPEKHVMEFPLKPLKMSERLSFTQYITFETDGLDEILLQSPNANTQNTKTLFNIALDTLSHLVQSPTMTFEELLNRRAAENNPPISFKSELAHNSFERIAAMYPLKPALKDDIGGVLSYGELETKANQFMHWLREKGIGPGDIVPLYMDKSFLTIVSIFGILKAGAAFAPLDPRNPDDRNRFIINEVGARLVVTDGSYEQAARELGVETIVVDHLDMSSYSQHSLSDVELAGPDNLVYVIYTSGSTGLPKGVLVSHRAVTASTEGMIEATGVDTSWVSLWVLNYVFDASYYDVFTLLSTGGVLCLAPQDTTISDLASLINNLDVTQVMLTPTIAKLLAPAQLPKLKVLLVCGEPITPEIAGVWASEKIVYNG